MKTPEAQTHTKPVIKITPKITLKKNAEDDPVPVPLLHLQEEEKSDPVPVPEPLNTYITPVYGVNMRVSLDNKYIYDMDFNLVGTVIDNKSIQWVGDNN